MINAIYNVLWTLFLMVLAVINTVYRIVTTVINLGVALVLFAADRAIELICLFVIGGFIYSVCAGKSTDVSLEDEPVEVAI